LKYEWQTTCNIEVKRFTLKEAPMKRVLIGLLAACAVGTFAQGQGIRDSDSIERPFASGGSVRLSLSSGDYTIRAGADDRVVVRWTPDQRVRGKDLRKVSIDVHTAGSAATITTDGPTTHLRFTIEIPARSDVYLRTRAGDVTVEGIEGNKDIRMTAGDLTIGVRPSSLSRAHASVTFGDLAARPLGISKGGIKRSFDWSGAGTYTVDARLFAGDLTLIAN
jgi:hypothetical protein